MKELLLPQKLPAKKVPVVPGVCPALVMNFLAYRIYRPESAESPRLYKIKSDFTYDSVNNVVVYPSMSVKYVGKVLYDRVMNTMLLEEKDSANILLLYASEKKKYLTAKPKGNFPEFEPWFKKSWERVVMSGVLLIPNEPLQFSINKRDYCLSYADLSRIKKGPYPAWQSFMSQMGEEERKLFGAFVFSVFDPQNTGRQVLYLYDNGRTGKSCVTNAITGALPEVSGSFSKESLTSRFGFSTIFGKRLLLYPDCKDPYIIRFGKLHSIVGNDPVIIEYKNEGAFTARVFSRAIIMSNVAPNIDSFKTNEKSRLIPIQLDPDLCDTKEHYQGGKFIGNNNYTNKLEEQFWHFMHFAFECYIELCPQRQELMVSEDVYSGLVSDDEDTFEEMIKEDFEVTGNYEDRIKAYDLLQFFKELDPHRNDKGFNYTLHNFKIFLENTKKVKYKRLSDARYYIGIKFRKNSMHIGDM